MVNEARMTPARNDGQNESPVRFATANGMKNGNPSGTRTSVSRASCVIVCISPDFVHVMMNAKMLTTGSVSNSAPRRGYRPDTSATATMTAAEMMAFTMSEVIVRGLFVNMSAVWFFFEVSGVWRAVDFGAHRTGEFADDAEVLMRPDIA